MVVDEDLLSPVSMVMMMDVVEVIIFSSVVYVRRKWSVIINYRMLKGNNMIMNLFHFQIRVTLNSLPLEKKTQFICLHLRGLVAEVKSNDRWYQRIKILAKAEVVFSTIKKKKLGQVNIRIYWVLHTWHSVGTTKLWSIQWQRNRHFIRHDLKST